MPSSARIVVTASGWVMYGSPLLRFWSRCQYAATPKARSMVRTSALGGVARTVLIKGSSTGFMVLARWAPSRASLRRTPVWPGDPPESAGPAEPAEPVAAAEPAVAVDRAAARARGAAAEPGWPPAAGAAGGCSGGVPG